ncbi:MAG: hypothetical protein E7604_10500 [Ruminococcaceae bacterium]|nr:hypothetical protein [Oscillospiraceae bacterium]
MKNLQTLFISVADEYHVSTAEVTDSIRAYLHHLLNDPDFRAAWEEIPKSDTCSEEEMLLALMIAETVNGGTDTIKKASFT